MIELRPIEQQDLFLIAGLANRAFGTGWRDEAWVESKCARSRVAPEDSRVARLDGEPVGYALVGYPEAPGAEVAHLGVVPEARRRGVARALLDDAAAAVARRGRREMWVTLDGGNDAAAACYRACGFEVARREPMWEIVVPDGPVPAFVADVVFRKIEEPLEMYLWYDNLPLRFDDWPFEAYRHFSGDHVAMRATRHGETIAAAYATHAPDYVTRAPGAWCVLGKLRLAEMADWVPEFLRTVARPGQRLAVTDASGRYGQWLASWGFTPGPVRLWMRRVL